MFISTGFKMTVTSKRNFNQIANCAAEFLKNIEQKPQNFDDWVAYLSVDKPHIKIPIEVYSDPEEYTTIIENMLKFIAETIPKAVFEAEIQGYNSSLGGTSTTCFKGCDGMVKTEVKNDTGENFAIETIIFSVYPETGLQGVFLDAFEKLSIDELSSAYEVIESIAEEFDGFDLECEEITDEECLEDFTEDILEMYDAFLDGDMCHNEAEFLQYLGKQFAKKDIPFQLSKELITELNKAGICIAEQEKQNSNDAGENYRDVTMLTELEDRQDIHTGEYAESQLLERIGIPNGVMSIGESAFSDCKNLTYIKIPNSVMNIEKFAFNRCKNLKGIIIPDSIANIGAYAFRGCESLTKIIIPNSVTSVRNFAFYNCKSLKEITIPNSVTDINGSVFVGCTNLKNIIIREDNPNYIFIAGKLFNKDKTSLIRYFGDNKVVNYTIPDGVTSIGDCAFCECDSLTEVTIPSITHIGRLAFASCYGLTKLAMPNSVNSIGDSAFKGCINLKEIEIPDKVWRIEDSTFHSCRNLTHVVIWGNLTSIEDYAFIYCENLKGITIPDSVSNIGRYTFSGCKSLKEIIIPNSVMSIGDYAFSECENLKEITISNSLTSIGRYVFSKCKKLKEITIPDGVTSIGDFAFSGCKDLTRVVIPDSVTQINSYSVFAGCKKLTIYGHKDSRAEQYAKENGIPFEEI